MYYNWETHWKDYYKILQVHPTAEQEVIQVAYSRLAKKYHPDINHDYSASIKMVEINEAYEVLGNLELRRLYHPEYLKRRPKDGQQPNLRNESANRGDTQKTKNRDNKESQKKRTENKSKYSLSDTKLGCLVMLVVALLIVVIIWAILTLSN